MSPIFFLKKKKIAASAEPTCLNINTEKQNIKRNITELNIRRNIKNTVIKIPAFLFATAPSIEELDLTTSRYTNATASSVTTQHVKH